MSVCVCVPCRSACSGGWCSGHRPRARHREELGPRAQHSRNHEVSACEYCLSIRLISSCLHHSHRSPLSSPQCRTSIPFWLGVLHHTEGSDDRHAGIRLLPGGRGCWPRPPLHACCPVAAWEHPASCGLTPPLNTKAPPTQPGQDVITDTISLKEWKWAGGGTTTLGTSGPRPHPDPQPHPVLCLYIDAGVYCQRTWTVLLLLFILCCLFLSKQEEYQLMLFYWKCIRIHLMGSTKTLYLTCKLESISLAGLICQSFLCQPCRDCHHGFSSIPPILWPLAFIP